MKQEYIGKIWIYLSEFLKLVFEGCVLIIEGVKIFFLSKSNSKSYLQKRGK